MVMAVAKAIEEGAKAVLCASTGNTSASAAAGSRASRARKRGSGLVGSATPAAGRANSAGRASKSAGGPARHGPHAGPAQAVVREVEHRQAGQVRRGGQRLGDGVAEAGAGAGGFAAPQA